MPIGLKYTIEQTPGAVILIVDVKNVDLKKLDVISTPFYVSISARPHLLVVDLHGSVKMSGHRCKLKKNKTLHLTLLKEEAGVWDRIEFIGNQESRMKRRDASLQAYRDAAKLAKHLKQQAAEARRRADIAADQRRRKAQKDAAQQIKDDEKAEALAHIEDIKREDAVQKVTGKTDPKDGDLLPVRSDSTTVVTTAFTQRRMQVPARDGRDEIYADSEVGPRDPQPPGDKLTARELVTKALKLVGTGDVAGAAEAAKMATDRAPMYLQAWLVASSIALKQGRVDTGMKTTSMALDIINLDTPVQKEQQTPTVYSRAVQSRVHSMRGAVLAQRGRYRDALHHTKTALDMTPGNKGLTRDNELLSRIVQLKDSKC
eukprot:gnl/Dysnectes_brevis/7272_a12049_453.p1 GENE.gnl/Dysnectes_brevis/7272_a12049_453~~gnl/Dysnectes_brevis/7272_a12049_453.p1  ORF type:complete len:373 (-),score=48.50 gnl/Dysnectes_brevis/7272_a12049_453:26-1144(-)